MQLKGIVFFQFSWEDLKTNRITSEPCADVNFDEAVNVPIDDLTWKYPSRNILINTTLDVFRKIGGCRLITDNTIEASE